MERKVFTMSFMQVFSTPSFYLSIIAVTALCFISVWDDLSEWGSNFSTAHYFDLFIGLTMFKKLVVLFAAVPYVSSFCSDWKYQFIKPVLIRTGIFKYIWSKVITCFVSGFLVVFLGLMIFITLLSLIVPMFDGNSTIREPFALLAEGQLPVLYLVAQSFIFSLAAALWTVVGLALSAFIPIHFVAITAPVIASYLLEELTRLLPNWLNLYGITRSANVIHQGPLISFAYFCFIFILFSALAGMVFSYQVRRRIHNEVV
ncbi:MAG TPA: hypothetical protein VKZ77_01020 [Bacillaceae bacterium]|nr:hypothetical protein [Bacillaceae bacterium]